MKEFDLIGLGNSLVDILLELTDAEFAALGFEKGTMRLVDPPEQQMLLGEFRDHEPRLVCGGSVANSIIACCQLGGKGAFIGCVGDDRYGLHYANEFAELRHRLRERPARRRDDRHLRQHHHARRGTHDANVPRGVEPPRRAARSSR